MTTQTITVPIIDDLLDEPDETFTVTLATPTNSTILDRDGLGTTVDNDAAPTLSIDDVTVDEAAGTATFTVSLSAPSGQTVTVNYATANGTATSGADFTPATGTLTFAPGVTTQTIAVPILEDTLDEADETFTVTLSNPSATATIADGTGIGTIVDNDAAPTLSIDDVTVDEAAGTATFTVSLSAASGQTVTVNYATANGTATSGADYTTTNGTLNFAPGDLTQTITVPILEDLLDELDETFTVTLSNPSATATIADGTGIGTIVDNDAAPTLSIDDVTVDEAAGTATFTVTLSATSGLPVSVNFATSSGTATSGADFTSAAGTLNFAPGETTKTITVPILQDAFDELDETFTVNLANPANATILDGQGVGTIVDNDAVPTLRINDVTRNEAAGTMTFTVTLSAASGLPVSVTFATSSGTATSGADFTPAAGTLSFAPGETTKSIVVTIANDPIFEQSERYNVRLSGAVNATITDATGIGTILDNGLGGGGTDNDTPTLAVSDATVTEGANPFAVFTVSLSNPSTKPVSFALALSNVTALGGGTDYGTAGAGNLQVSTDNGATWNDATSATIAPGTTSVLVRTPITDDLLDEDLETFTLTATRTEGTTTNVSALGTGMINDNDAPPVVSPPEEPEVEPEFVFGFDGFHNFSTAEEASIPRGPWVVPTLQSIDVWRPALLPLAPIYSGEADPGATLIIELYNANGARIATQMVLADAGGNWLANFGSAVLRDTPSAVRITQVNAPYAFGMGTGHNLRTYYAPAAINPGHFLSHDTASDLGDESAPLLGGLDLANPIQLGPVKVRCRVSPKRRGGFREVARSMF